MSIPNKKSKFKSIHKRGYSLPILNFLSELTELTTFGKIMEELNISKRGLSLTLKDLEADGLIEKSKVGRNTLVTITTKGRKEIESLGASNKTSDIIDEALNSTIKQLEKENIISPDWSPQERKEFVQKIKQAIANQVKKIDQM